MKQYILNIIIATFAILTPIQEAMVGIGVLITIDLIFALIAAYKNGIKIESKKLKFSAVKMLVYNLLVISAFVAQTFLSDYIPFIKITLAFIALVEFTSIGEKFQLITGLSFIKFIKNYLNEKLNKTTIDIKEKVGEEEDGLEQDEKR